MGFSTRLEREDRRKRKEYRPLVRPKHISHLLDRKISFGVDPEGAYVLILSEKAECDVACKNLMPETSYSRPFPTVHGRKNESHSLSRALVARDLQDARVSKSAKQCVQCRKSA